MKRFTYTGESTADATGTHALGTVGQTYWVDIKSLTISTRGADVAKDVKIEIKDASEARWVGYLRSGKEFGKEFSDIGMVKMTDAFTIVTSAVGAAGIAVVSCVYSCYTQAEETLNQAGI